MNELTIKYIEKILDDTYKIGRTDEAMQIDDYATLKAGILKKAQAVIDSAITEARLREHKEWILPIVEAAHSYEQNENGSGIQYFDNLRLGRLRELKGVEAQLKNNTTKQEDIKDE